MEERKFRMIVYRINSIEFSVLSLNSTFGKPKQYLVKWAGCRWMCNCPDYIKHMEEIDYTCKHIQAMFMAVAGEKWNGGGVEVEVVKYNGRNGNGKRE